VNDLARDQVTPLSKQAQLARSGSGIGLKKTAAGAGAGRKFRTKADREQWEEIIRLKLGPCLVCMYLGEKQKLPSSLHHIVSKSLGGDDVSANFGSVCGDGTTGHHGQIEAHDEETCRVFAAAVQQFDDAAYTYAIEKLGEDGWLRRYKVEAAA
jgi:hypothetical protein